jgi:hypothetical protein
LLGVVEPVASIAFVNAYQLSYVRVLVACVKQRIRFGAEIVHPDRSRRFRQRRTRISPRQYPAAQRKVKSWCRNQRGVEIKRPMP